MYVHSVKMVWRQTVAKKTHFRKSKLKVHTPLGPQLAKKGC